MYFQSKNSKKHLELPPALFPLPWGQHTPCRGCSFSLDLRMKRQCRVADQQHLHERNQEIQAGNLKTLYNHTLEIKKKKNSISGLLLLSCFSRVWLCATPQTAAHQAPPSLGFSRQEHWSGFSLNLGFFEHWLENPLGLAQWHGDRSNSSSVVTDPANYTLRKASFKPSLHFLLTDLVAHPIESTGK